MLHILKLTTMQQHGSKYFANRHTLNPGGFGQKVNPFFLKVVMLHIKFKGIACVDAQTYLNLLCMHMPTCTLCWIPDCLDRCFVK